MTLETQSKRRQRAVLVGIQTPEVDDDAHRGSLAELGRLVQTLGYDVVATISQKRASPLAATVIGEGKLKELATLTGGTGEVESKIPAYRRKHQDDSDDDDDDKSAAELAALAQAAESGAEAQADVVIFDMELTPNQLRNLETATGADVLDRTNVIVEIFHRHAHTREARIQVEIAQLRYLAPRLRVTKSRGNREGGGIGSRGAGESAHELDRRRIRDRISELTAELEEIHKNQQGRRDRRRDAAKVALVGYTNAGKSSLMRALTGSEVLVEDKLFATLDTTIRAMQPEAHPRVLVSDTVGFIKKLPHDLVASFRSTLDEARDASLLLHVVDAADVDFRSQLEVTRGVLKDLNADGAPSLLILNKTDKLDDEARRALLREFPDGIQLSTRRAEDIEALKARILAFFEASMTETELLIPFQRGELLGVIRKTMRVLDECHLETGTLVRVRADGEALAKVKKALHPGPT